MVRSARLFFTLSWLLLTLGCARLPQGATVTPLSPTVSGGASATPDPAQPFLGQFDCYGQEAGLSAYAGRVTLAPGGRVGFAEQTGQWTYEPTGARLTFAGSTDLGTATYQASDDTLVVAIRAGSSVAHAEGGRMDCVRARPGITGPG